MRLLTLAVLLLAAPAGADIFLLRHAETVDGAAADPALSELGKQRAQSVARRLAALEPTAVYSTDYARTRATARIIAEAAGLEVGLYDPRDAAAMLASVRDAAGHQVVVGHSNTVPALVHALGGDPGPDIDHGEYDRLYRLTGDAGAVVTAVLRSDPRHPRATPRPLRVDPERIRDEALVFEMRLDGDLAGTATWRYRRAGDRIVLEEETRLADHDTDATIRVETNAGLAAGVMSMRGKMFGSDAAIETTWEPRRVSGTSSMPRAPYRPQGRIELAADWSDATVERSTALMLAHAVRVGDEGGAFRWFNTYDGQFHDIRLERIGDARISVPAGSFDTYKLRYSGGAPSQVFYVTKTAPHRTVRIDVVAMPWRYELARIED